MITVLIIKNMLMLSGIWQDLIWCKNLKSCIYFFTDCLLSIVYGRKVAYSSFVNWKYVLRYILHLVFRVHVLIWIFVRKKDRVIINSESLLNTTRIYRQLCGIQPRVAAKHPLAHLLCWSRNES